MLSMDRSKQVWRSTSPDVLCSGFPSSQQHYIRYPVTHPFATSLGGSDNIVLFHTERYSPRPLIVQGAGAGAAVTAMGVLGDLLKF